MSPGVHRAFLNGNTEYLVVYRDGWYIASQVVAPLAVGGQTIVKELRNAHTLISAKNWCEKMHQKYLIQSTTRRLIGQ